MLQFDRHFPILQKCGEMWQKQMPQFDARRLNRTWKRARLKLFGGKDATQSWNWVAHISEIGYKQGKTVHSFENQNIKKVTKNNKKY